MFSPYVWYQPIHHAYLQFHGCYISPALNAKFAGYAFQFAETKWHLLANKRKRNENIPTTFT